MIIKMPDEPKIEHRSNSKSKKLLSFLIVREGWLHFGVNMGRDTDVIPNVGSYHINKAMPQQDQDGPENPFPTQFRQRIFEQ